eukprot:TRINITY_DN17334_c0_g1_i1.p1 TRINITY_DN17334_c0_g1~~TRINITY_DN17334_c0_g1_i1.p1  ORF type:complete len:581 (+),score=75.71 TRINITY_DN17334_c0_g1_i1:35-1777(+)
MDVVHIQDLHFLAVSSETNKPKADAGEKSFALWRSEGLTVQALEQLRRRNPVRMCEAARVIRRVLKFQLWLVHDLQRAFRIHLVRALQRMVREHLRWRNTFIHAMVKHWSRVEEGKESAEPALEPPPQLRRRSSSIGSVPSAFAQQMAGPAPNEFDEALVEPIWTLFKGRLFTMQAKYRIVRELYRVKRCEFAERWERWQRFTGINSGHRTLFLRLTHAVNQARRAQQNKHCCEPSFRSALTLASFFLVEKGLKDRWLTLLDNERRTSEANGRRRSTSTPNEAQFSESMVQRASSVAAMWKQRGVVRRLSSLGFLPDDHGFATETIDAPLPLARATVPKRQDTEATTTKPEKDNPPVEDEDVKVDHRPRSPPPVRAATSLEGSWSTLENDPLAKNRRRPSRTHAHFSGDLVHSVELTDSRLPSRCRAESLRVARPAPLTPPSEMNQVEEPRQQNRTQLSTPTLKGRNRSATVPQVRGGVTEDPLSCQTGHLKPLSETDPSGASPLRKDNRASVDLQRFANRLPPSSHALLHSHSHHLASLAPALSAPSPSFNGNPGSGEVALSPDKLRRLKSLPKTTNPM